jgi:hypothetical protein
MYTVYRKFREGTGQNLTLLCDSPAVLKDKSWDVLEATCERTVTTPQPGVTGSTANTADVNTANTTAVSTSQPDQFNTSVQQNVSVKESFADALHWASLSFFHSPSTFVVIFVVSLAVAVLITVLVVNKVVKRLGKGTRQLDHLWWEDVVARKDLMSG